MCLQYKCSLSPRISVPMSDQISAPNSLQLPWAWDRTKLSVSLSSFDEPPNFKQNSKIPGPLWPHFGRLLRTSGAMSLHRGLLFPFQSLMALQIFEISCSSSSAFETFWRELPALLRRSRTCGTSVKISLFSTSHSWPF